MKRLYRNKSDMMIAGVCSGLAKYIGVDPTAVRLAFIILLFMGMGGFWIYIILWVIMPLEPGQTADSIEVKEKPSNEPANLLPEVKSKKE
jgi:phage shock protein C